MALFVQAFLFCVFAMFLTLCGCTQENDTDLFLQSELEDFLNLSDITRTSVDKGNSTSILPDVLNDTCKLILDSDDKTYHFACLIEERNSDIWNFDHIRTWISSSEFDFKFDIKCVGYTQIALPWPIRAKHIVYIKVVDCTITNFFSDFGNPLIETIPDTLKTMDIQNAIISLGLRDLLSFVRNFKNISEEYDCGSDETIEKLVYKNITYRFKDEETEKLMNGGKSVEDGILSSGSEMIANTRSVDHNCKYRKLKFLDQSTSDSKSRYFLSILTELSSFPLLEFYNLSNTGQTEIAKEFKTWWRFFPKMKLLDLSHNFISEIDLDSSASEWKKYNLTIDLTYNNITEIGKSHLELLAGIPNMFIDVSNNPVDCSCSEHMLELLEVIHDNIKWEDMKLERYKYLKSMTCNMPIELKGRQLFEIKPVDLACPKYTLALSVAPIVILSTTIVILVVIIIVLTKFRKEIFILTYTRFHIILPCQPADVSENKKYDAFVSYSSHDEEWVSKTFKDLEASSTESYHQFKFCLHHRDFIPGKTIFDNVIDSVESSRHTVIILSRHFLQSHYCMYEFHEAFQQSIIERKRHMVVVMMENIPEEELPSDLKRCLKTFTYIKKDDSIFTDRLIYAMSHKTRRDSKSSNKHIGTEVHINAGFTPEKDLMTNVYMSRPKHDDSVVTLSQIVPDLVVGHNEPKSNGFTFA